MKLTDIDLSNLAEVGKAIRFLVHVEGHLVNGDTPLPELIVNPALLPPTQGSGETMMTPFARQQAAPISDDATRFGCAGSSFGFPTAALAADAEKLRGLGVDPVTAQPATMVLQQGTQSVAFQSMDECRAALVADAEVRRADPMDAASVFGGAPAQSAAPLPPAPSTAGVAASPTAPAVPLASGALPTLPALAPLPAPSAAAPTAPAAPSSPAGGVELDTDGLPWDARIHAGTKRKNADGRWTAKKGINDPDLVPRVVAQLRAQMAAGGLISGNINAQPVATAPAPHVVAQSAAPLPPSTPAPSTPPLAALPATSGPASLAAPPPPALPVAPTPAAPQQYSAPAPTTFQDFMTALTVEVQAGRVPIEALGAACQPLGGVSALNAKPELIPVAWATLKAKYPGML